MADKPQTPQDTPTEQMPGGAAPSPSPPAGHDGPATGGLGFNLKPSVPPQDLSQDKLLATAPRAPVGEERIPTPALGNIPLLAKLGQGGMGAVYYGIHPRLDVEVAVKVLPFNLAEQHPEMIERFFREAKVAAQVKSSHLVQVTDVNEESGLYYIVMEFVRGVSAGDHIRKLKEEGQQLSEASALDICFAATQGLVAAHNKGVIHRDIKPDNIMIPKAEDGEGLAFSESKLTDLGLARGEEFGRTLTGTQATMGTPGYLAPEQAEDAKRAGKPADVFSMGATLYSLLAGQAPFTGSSLLRVLTATAQEPHNPIGELRPEVSEATSGLIDRSLAKSPGGRYADAVDLLEALTACRSSTVQRATQVTSPSAQPEPGPTRVAGPSPILPPATAERTIASPARPYEVHAPPAPSTRLTAGKVAMSLAVAALLVGTGLWWATKGSEGPVRQDSKERVSHRDNAAKRMEALEGQASVEALRTRLEKAEKDLKANVRGAPHDAVLMKLNTLCAKHAFGGSNYQDADKSFNLGKALITDKQYGQAIEEFREAKTGLNAALNFWRFAESALRMEDTCRQSLNKASGRVDPSSMKLLKDGAGYLAAGKAWSSFCAYKRALELVGYPLWDAKEGIADYANRTGLRPTRSLDLGAGVKLELVLIPAGTFVMGSPESEERRDSDETQHQVTLTKPFYMARCETTQSQYRCIMGANPSWYKDADNPVERITFADAVEFCKKATEELQSEVRLPTEAEWEFACRAGTTTPFHFGETISTDQVNYCGKYVYGNGRKGLYRSRTANVGSFVSNRFGLQNMHGNVSEWCMDWYGEYPKGPVKDPTGPSNGTRRVMRGGHYGGEPWLCRSADRSGCGLNPDFKEPSMGFRVVLPLF